MGSPRGEPILVFQIGSEMDTNLSNYQQQPTIMGHLAGTGWGQRFIAEEVFPPTPTGGRIFSYQSWDNAGMVALGGAAKRGVRANTKYVEPPKAGVVTAQLYEYALYSSLDINEIRAAEARDAMMRAESGGAAVPGALSGADQLRLGLALDLDLKIQLDKEIDTAALAFDPANYVADLTYGGGLGHVAVDFAAAGIIAFIETVRHEVGRRSGFEADALVLGYLKVQDLLKNPEVIARVTGGATNAMPAKINDDLLALLFGVKRIIRCSAVSQIPADAGQSGTPTDIWTPTTAALLYTGQGATSTPVADGGQGVTSSLASPAFGKMFQSTAPNSAVRRDVATYLSGNKKIEYTEVTELALPAITFKSAGAIFTA